ncbi:similar to Saccharomyces cerevisiae YEL040W UTR2 Chitin transglycosylase that functions in the transfer of chitin to beta(1-6) and beta(1-3) glucans in the cell wall [Maudiozyma saulgeensis]|uniref:Crh-like protein n=1 Tax=Maudiozyma saulgeensis TaxID=1789683 RepID=A0A1X7QXK4_9SACH|nr:similar to Saccharomyces cerevisiae YEL040W UTR2 Chitin transglycosylase that functions in the transfer of chitin to beta(1-6) and beta(1-3) glucans in the cell wall [Kazachstania saulgeensis]
MRFITSILCLIATTAQVIAAAEVYTCNATVSCPEEYPCCSQYGQCGTGEYCLSNCNPIFSYEYDACLPEPVCKDISTKFDNYTSKVANINTFLGNASEADWLYTGTVLDYDDEGSMILAMPKNSGGTVLTSSRDVWYGKISARLKSSHLAGVITAFIVFSGVQDELDFEWVGADLNTVQTNYYWQGLLDYHNSANISTNDTFDNYHTYEIDWHEDYTTWSIDGVIGRTLLRNETWNETLQAYKYPQTPSRIHLSIWPGGNATNAPGTIAWAGGEIDWDADDITDPGYYYAIVNEINVTCYDAPSGTSQNGTESYIYKNGDTFLQSDVMISNKRFYLDSYEGTGLNITAGATTSSTASSSSATSSTSHNSTSKESSTSHDSSTSVTSSAYHNSSSTGHSTASITSVSKSSSHSSSGASRTSSSNTSSRLSSANSGSLMSFNNIILFFSALGLLL